MQFFSSLLWVSTFSFTSMVILCHMFIIQLDSFVTVHNPAWDLSTYWLTSLSLSVFLSFLLSFSILHTVKFVPLYSTMQNSLFHLKHSFVVTASSVPNPWQLSALMVLSFSKISWKWNHVICNLWICLLYVTKCI